MCGLRGSCVPILGLRIIHKGVFPGGKFGWSIFFLSRFFWCVRNPPRNVLETPVGGRDIAATSELGFENNNLLRCDGFLRHGSPATSMNEKLGRKFREGVWTGAAQGAKSKKRLSVFPRNYVLLRPPRTPLVVVDVA